MSTTTVVRLCNAPTPPPRFTNHRRRQRLPNPNLRRSRLQPKQRLTDETFPCKNKLVWGNVRILKQGEPPLPAGSCLINKESRVEQTTVKESLFFAGGGFLASPSPSLLPLPGFLAMKTFNI